METLKSRILIISKEGTEIAYLYDRDAFNLLEIERHPYDHSQFIEIGQIFSYDGIKYKVESINFKLEAKIHKMDNRIGFNMHSPTEQSDFNSQIGIFVEKLD